MRCSLFAGAIAAAGLVAAAPKNKSKASSSELSSSTCSPVTTTVTTTATTTKTKVSKVTGSASTVTATQEVTLPAVTVTSTITPAVVTTTILSAETVTVFNTGSSQSSTTSHTTSSSLSSSTSTKPTSTTAHCSLISSTFAVAIQAPSSTAIAGYLALTNGVATGDDNSAYVSEAYDVGTATSNLASAQLFSYELISGDYAQYSTLKTALPHPVNPGEVAFPINMKYFHENNGKNETTSDLLAFYNQGTYYDSDDGLLFFELLEDCSFSIFEQDYSWFPVIAQQEQGTGYITITTPGNATMEPDMSTIRLMAVPAP